MCTVLQIKANTWPLLCAELTDNEPVWGWTSHTSNFFRGLHSKWMRKPESPLPSTRYSLESSTTDTGFAHHSLKQSWSSWFSSTEPTAKPHWFSGSVLLEHNAKSYYRFPVVTKRVQNQAQKSDVTCFLETVM